MQFSIMKKQGKRLLSFRAIAKEIIQLFYVIFTKVQGNRFIQLNLRWLVVSFSHEEIWFDVNVEDPNCPT